MKELQRIFQSRNAGARRAALRILTLLVIVLSTVGACDFLVNDGNESTPSDPPPGPGPDPGPDPSPDPTPTPGPNALTRAPYLQSLGTRSVIVAFRTQDAVAGVVDYGTTLAYGATATGPVSQSHAVELPNLAPGQRYYYRVRSGDETLADGAGLSFDTDGGRNDTQFSFFATADIGKPGGDQDVTAQRVLQTTPRAELGILAGDIIYPDGEASDYDEKLMQPWADLLSTIPVWPALGNHDWHVDPETNFCAQWVLPNNEHYYSFDRGNAHFIALDTEDGQIYERDKQVAWLRADLEAHRDATWTFVYYHHPGYTCTYKNYNNAVIENFQPVFDEFAVDVVFMGHAHTYERLYPIRGTDIPRDVEQEPNYRDPSGTIYIVSGAAASTENDVTPDCSINAKAIDDTVLFCHVTVNGNTVRIRAIVSATGAVVDEITITKTGL